VKEMCKNDHAPNTIKNAITQTVNTISNGSDDVFKSMNVSPFDRNRDNNIHYVANAAKLQNIDYDASGTTLGNKSYKSASNIQNCVTFEVEIEESCGVTPETVVCKHEQDTSKVGGSCPNKPNKFDANAQFNDDLVDERGNKINDPGTITKYKTCADTFSGNVEYKEIPPGTVLVRYTCQRNIEPGAFWTELKDVRLSLGEIRRDTAVLPDWNTDGAMEMLVVPESPKLHSFSGKTATQVMNASLCSNPGVCHVHTNGVTSNNTYKCGNKKEAFMFRGGTTQHCLDKYLIQVNDDIKKCIMMVGNTGIRVPDKYSP
jgi:hypothetical protein